MKVFGISTDKQEEWTTPFPDNHNFGIKLRLVGGNILDPIFGWKLKEGYSPDTKPNWFNSRPAHLMNIYCPVACLPFFSIGIGSWGMYCGWKVFGVDSESYKDWLDPSCVYNGSQAVCLSIRMSTRRPRK